MPKCLCGCGEQTERWEVRGDDGRTIGTYRLYVRGHENRPGDTLLKEEEDILEKRDPLCLAVGDAMGNDLINRAVAAHGTAMAVEDHLNMSHGGLNRYRSERYINFDLVDKLLVLLGEPQELTNYEFRRRSEWQLVAVERRSTKKPCSVEGCDEPHHAKDLCSRHYRHLRRRSLSAR
jgi:hypothetical protein